MGKQLTLNELIEKALELKEQGYGELLVTSQGCDCDGNVGSISIDKDVSVFRDGKVVREDHVHLERVFDE